MAQKTLQLFFTGKSFVIPSYQQDYSWETQNVDELLDDIHEAMELNSSHYIGTFILSEAQKDGQITYEVVDGQQRLTTLTMILSTVIELLPDMKQKIINEDTFIKTTSGWRLQLLGKNNVFFQSMLEGSVVHASNKSQKLLLQAFNHIKMRIHDHPAQSFDLLEYIKNLEVMEFVESNAGKAIRIFQTVNDRGKPLSNLDKAKSLLIYYSNRFLHGLYDDMINEHFGAMYDCFNEIKECGQRHAVNLISQRNFTEDSIMRYHFIAYENKYWDYDATNNYVMDVFLKQILKEKKSNSIELGKFINDYVSDLATFFQALRDMIHRMDRDERYYTLFSILGMSASHYPLSVRLEMRNFLEHQHSAYQGKTFLELLEITDVRVYKTRATDPRRDVSHLACKARTASDTDIANQLVNFVHNFMNDTEFRIRLEADIYGNYALKHLFMRYDEHILKTAFSLQQLQALNQTEPTIEHVFAQDVKFPFPGRQFANEQEYTNSIHKLGNLTLLEKNLNSKASNKSPEQKVHEGIYRDSSFKLTQQLGIRIHNDGQFTKDHVNMRTNELVTFCVGRWKI